MSYLHKGQDKSVKDAQIQYILLEIIRIKKIGQEELGEKLGYSRETTNIAINKSIASNAFKIAAALLLENIQMRERLKKIEEAQRTLALLTQPTAPYFLNDEPPEEPEGGTPVKPGPVSPAGPGGSSSYRAPSATKKPNPVPVKMPGKSAERHRKAVEESQKDPAAGEAGQG